MTDSCLWYKTLVRKFWPIVKPSVLRLCLKKACPVKINLISALNGLSISRCQCHEVIEPLLLNKISLITYTEFLAQLICDDYLFKLTTKNKQGINNLILTISPGSKSGVKQCGFTCLGLKFKGLLLVRIFGLGFYILDNNLSLMSKQSVLRYWRK